MLKTHISITDAERAVEEIARLKRSMRCSTRLTKPPSFSRLSVSLISLQCSFRTWDATLQTTTPTTSGMISASESAISETRHRA
jgi:hypothetical protein